jgi:hypothetical protein
VNITNFILESACVRAEQEISEARHFELSSRDWQKFSEALDRPARAKPRLKRPLIRIAQAADIVGARAVLVHAIDEPAKKFYQHFDFEPSPIHELQLMLLMKDLRKALEE